MQIYRENYSLCYFHSFDASLLCVLDWKYHKEVYFKMRSKIKRTGNRNAACI